MTPCQLFPDLCWFLRSSLFRITWSHSPIRDVCNRRYDSSKKQYRPKKCCNFIKTQNKSMGFFARRAYCIVLQNFHVRLSVCRLSSVCPLDTKTIVTFLCYFELFLDPRNSVYRLWNVQNLGQKRDPELVDFEVFGTRFWTFHRLINGEIGVQNWDKSWHVWLSQALRATCPAGVI